MERGEFKTLVKGMKAVYAQPTFIPDQDAFNIWYGLLQDIPYEVAAAGIQAHMMQSKFPPTIAEIREKCVERVAPEKENDSEAWDLVYKAICNSSYNSEQEYEKLPTMIQRAVGSPNQLRAWAIDSDFNAGVESSNFKKVYRQVQEREKKNLQLPEHLRLQQESMNLIERSSSE